MQSFKPFLRWTGLHLLVFLFSPVGFALAGLLVGVLVSVEPYVFGVRSPLSSRLQPYYNQGLYLLGPLVSGGILGGVTAGLQSTAIRKTLPKFHALRWTALGALGMTLAFLAFAWAFNGQFQVNPLLLASLFSAAVYGLAASLPQSRSLKEGAGNGWRWLLFSTLAALFSFALVCAPVWVAEGPAYFWLIPLLGAIGGILFGILTGLEFNRWSHSKKHSNGGSTSATPPSSPAPSP